MSTEFYLTLARRAAPAAVAEALGAALETRAYLPYDPFPGGAGPARIWADKVTAFVAPAQDGWTRVIGRVPPEALAAASASLATPLLHLWLTGATWGFFLFVDGDDLTDAAALAGFLRPQCTTDDLQRAMAGDIDTAALPPIEGEPGDDALPENVAVLAADRNIDMSKAQRMIEKYTGKIFSKLDRQSQDQDDEAVRAAAMEALRGGPALWETACGRRLRAFAACLDLPRGWHSPALETVRDAYTVARRKAAYPTATLLPGDRRALDKLPGAGDYLPVYFGVPKS
ncbi:MAG: hypothetical protein JXB47_10005 [Anaerolineae bacterium]|nr:hypothetical protein [Anaerolineae bacterium]